MDKTEAAAGAVYLGYYSHVPYSVVDCAAVEEYEVAGTQLVTLDFLPVVYLLARSAVKVIAELPEYVTRESRAIKSFGPCGSIAVAGAGERGGKAEHLLYQIACCYAVAAFKTPFQPFFPEACAAIQTHVVGCGQHCGVDGLVEP